jgi:hypothetical protein
VNAFRVPFLRALFPDAVFIHLLRNGIEVARSIERESAAGPWYGAGDYKWHQLAGLAGADHRPILTLCRGAYERGLLEWRLAVEHVLRTTADLPSERLLTVRYEDLLEAPVATVRRIEDFLGLAHDEAPARYAAQKVVRRSAPASSSQVGATTRAIGGELLARLGYADASAAPRG